MTQKINKISKYFLNEVASWFNCLSLEYAVCVVIGAILLPGKVITKKKHHCKINTSFAMLKMFEHK